MLSEIFPKKSTTFLVYVLFLTLGVGAFLLVDQWGNHLFLNQVVGALPSKGSGQQINALLHILLALTAVILSARVMGALFKLINQPPVIGEVVGGILLGPSLLGWLAPELHNMILPKTAMPLLGIIAQLGVIFYMFVVGLEMDLKQLIKSGHKTLVISHISIVVPFVMGSALALYLFPILAPSGVGFTSFALFMGISMSITAFPVLARILTDRQMNKTPLGNLALSCAAIDDVSAWCLLALVVSIAEAHVGSALMTMLMTVVYILAMFFIGRPLMKRFMPVLEKLDEITEAETAVFFFALLVSALATELIGIHAIFGAFLLGVIIPHDSRVASELNKRVGDLVRIVFLPTFFAFTGMRTEIGLLTSTSDWLLCGLIILVATAGKWGASTLAARFTGMSWRESSALGILMNTRGLVELIVLNIGLDMGILSPRLFTMLVVMALVTTFLTSPILQWVMRDERPVLA